MTTKNYDKNKKKRNCYLKLNLIEKAKFCTIIFILNIFIDNLKIQKNFLFVQLFKKVGYLFNSDIPVLIENKKFELIEIENLFNNYKCFGLIKMKIKKGLQISKKKIFLNNESDEYTENILKNEEFFVVV
jgi:hypothetical protein